MSAKIYITDTNKMITGKRGKRMTDEMRQLEVKKMRQLEVKKMRQLEVVEGLGRALLYQ